MSCIRIYIETGPRVFPFTMATIRSSHTVRPKRKIFLSPVSIRFYILGSDGRAEKFFYAIFFLFFNFHERTA